MPAYKTCARCGKPTTNSRYCDQCPAPRSPSNRAQDAEYRANRKTVLANSPTCSYCSRPATSVDHIKPVSKGGTHALENLVGCCSSCNSSKGNREDWQPANRTRPTDPEPKRVRPAIY